MTQQNLNQQRKHPCDHSKIKTGIKYMLQKKIYIFTIIKIPRATICWLSPVREIWVIYASAPPDKLNNIEKNYF